MYNLYLDLKYKYVNINIMKFINKELKNRGWISLVVSSYVYVYMTLGANGYTGGSNIPGGYYWSNYFNNFSEYFFSKESLFIYLFIYLWFVIFK